MITTVIFGVISRLEEAEDRYRDRESRPEDLDLIERLQKGIEEREAAVQRMVVRYMRHLR